MTRWTEAELDLFKSKRQRGTAPPPPYEFELHCLVADVLKRWCNPSWRYTHVPLGEKRGPETAARLKRMGVTAGWPDFQFFHMNGRVAFLELKREGNKPTKTQDELGAFLANAGHGYRLADDFGAVLGWLREMGIVPARVSQLTKNVEQRDTPSWPAAQERAIE